MAKNSMSARLAELAVDENWYQPRPSSAPKVVGSVPYLTAAVELLVQRNIWQGHLSQDEMQQLIELLRQAARHLDDVATRAAFYAALDTAGVVWSAMVRQEYPA
ncbi:MAG TPA: hypothetical protein VHR55_07990 [Candidatus Limnocylindria bacterium]|nr:hypothetical protein [Candidatus Limnocylindria bacterium]